MAEARNKGHGDPQVMAEAIACLLLRNDVTQITVGVRERIELYELFPRGFGLTAFAVDATGEVCVTLHGEPSLEMLTTLGRQLDEGLRPELPPLITGRGQPGGTTGGNRAQRRRRSDG
jgi:hypothetical protein